jgi:hypothetical protein
LYDECIDYRCEDRNVVGELSGDIGAIKWSLTPSFRKPLSSPLNNEAFSQEMHLKIPLLKPRFEIVEFETRS